MRLEPGKLDSQSPKLNNSNRMEACFRHPVIQHFQSGWQAV
jgi:hypothetical protein